MKPLRQKIEELRRKGAVLEVVGGSYISQDNSMGNFRRARLLELDCSNSDFVQADFRRATIKEAFFEDCDLVGSSFQKAKLISVNFACADFTGTDFFQVFAEELNCNEAILVSCNFDRAKLVRSSFIGADLRGADLRGADLSNSDFAGADLTEANFTGAKLDWCNFAGAVLEGARLWDVSTVNANFNMTRGVEIPEIYAHVADTMHSRRVGQNFRPRCRSQK